MSNQRRRARCNVAAKKNETSSADKSKPVIVRSHLAGVFFGYLQGEPSDTHVRLVASRRLYGWTGALCVDTIAVYGVTGGRVCDPVDQDVYGQILQVIPCTAAAVTSIESQPIAR
jgi:hypothetical protein